MYASSHTPSRHGRDNPVAVSGNAGGRKVTAASWPRLETETVREMTFEPGKTIFFDGDKAEYFYEIIAGTVRCCRLTQDGRRQIYRFATGGEMLGLGGEEHNTYSAEAVTKVVVQRHSLMSLETAMAREPKLRDRVLRSLRDELAAVRTQMVLLGQMTASERVASFLIDWAASAGEAADGVTLPMTRSDIADYLGLTIETVSRKINELKRQHVIDFTGPHEIRLTNTDRLAEIAEAA